MVLKYILLFSIFFLIGSVLAVDLDIWEDSLEVPEIKFVLPEPATTGTVYGNYTNLSELLDTNISTPSDQDVLTWDDATKKWIAQAISALSKWIVDVSGEYLYNNSDTIFFNTTKNNETINNIIDSRLDGNASSICSGAEALLGNGTCANSSNWIDSFTDTWALNYTNYYNKSQIDNNLSLYIKNNTNVQFLNISTGFINSSHLDVFSYSTDHFSADFKHNGTKNALRLDLPNSDNGVFAFVAGTSGQNIVFEEDTSINFRTNTATNMRSASVAGWINRLVIDAVGGIYPATDDVSDIGKGGTNEIRNIYIDGVAYIDTLNTEYIGSNLLPLYNMSQNIGSGYSVWNSIYFDTLIEYTAPNYIADRNVREDLLKIDYEDKNSFPQFVFSPAENKTTIEYYWKKEIPFNTSNMLCKDLGKTNNINLSKGYEDIDSKTGKDIYIPVEYQHKVECLYIGQDGIKTNYLISMLVDYNQELELRVQNLEQRILNLEKRL